MMLDVIITLLYTVVGTVAAAYFTRRYLNHRHWPIATVGVCLGWPLVGLALALRPLYRWAYRLADRHVTQLEARREADRQIQAALFSLEDPTQPVSLTNVPDLSVSRIAS